MMTVNNKAQGIIASAAAAEEDQCANIREIGLEGTANEISDPSVSFNNNRRRRRCDGGKDPQPNNKEPAKIHEFVIRRVVVGRRCSV